MRYRRDVFEVETHRFLYSEEADALEGPWVPYDFRYIETDLDAELRRSQELRRSFREKHPGPHHVSLRTKKRRVDESTSVDPK